MESHHADGCSYAIYSLQKISGWEDPDMVSNELHNVVLYVGQSSTFSALSVPQAESIGQSLNAIFQFHDCLEVAVECIEVVLKLMQTDCHWLLKNRILVAVESDMVRMYMMRSSNLRNSVRTCLHSHIFYTMNTGPAIRVLASVCLHEDCDARTREDTIIALQMLLNDFPEAKIPDEELEILMMFLLEKAIDREAIDLYTFKKLFQILEGATLHNSFKNSIENMPDHLRSFYFNRLRWYGVKPLGADQYSFSGHNAQRLPFDKPLASKVNSAFKDEYTDLTYAPAYDFNQFSLKNVSEAVPMALLTQLLRDDTDWHRLRAAEQLHVYYTQKLSNVSPMEAGMFIGDICKNLPALLRMFQKILYDSNPHVILALLETLEVIVTNLPRMIAEKNSPRILETLSSVLGSQDELVRHRVNKFLVRLSNVVSVETVLDKILEDIRTASSTQRMGLLDGLFHLLSAFPWAPWDRIRMTDALSSCLIDHNAQVRAIAAQCFAITSNQVPYGRYDRSVNCGLFQVIQGLLGNRSTSIPLRSLTTLAEGGTIQPEMRMVKPRPIFSGEKFLRLPSKERDQQWLNNAPTTAFRTPVRPRLRNKGYIDEKVTSEGKSKLKFVRPKLGQKLWRIYLNGTEEAVTSPNEEEQKNDYTRPSKRAFRDEDDATAAYQPLPDQSHMDFPKGRDQLTVKYRTADIERLVPMRHLNSLDHYHPKRNHECVCRTLKPTGSYAELARKCAKGNSPMMAEAPRNCPKSCEFAGHIPRQSNAPKRRSPTIAICPKLPPIHTRSSSANVPLPRPPMRYNYPTGQPRYRRLQSPVISRSLDSIRDSARVRRHQLLTQKIRLEDPGNSRRKRVRPTYRSASHPLYQEARCAENNTHNSASTRQVNTRIARSLSRVCQYSAQQNDQKNNSQSKSNSTLSHIPVLTQTMPKQNPARPRQIPFVSRSVSPECLSRTRAKIRRRDRSLEPMGQMIRSLQSSEWDRQLEGVEMLKQLLQTEKHAVLNRLCEDPRLMRQVVVDLANASKCLRSQVSRTSLETTRLLANSLRQINEGNKLDPSADMIIDSLLARVAGDKSTKFLQQESSECLLEVCSTISAARAVTSLANRLIDQKIKSPHGRYAVGMVIVHVLNQCSMSENGLLLLLDRMGTDGLHQCILAASILLEDGKSATRSQGRQILQILARIADIEQASHRLLSQRAWRNIVTALQDRVMTALKRCRALTEKNATPHLRTDKEAASRFIKHALWQSAHSKAKKRRADAGDGSSK